MKTTTINNWRKFMATSGYCTPPGKVACAMRSARILDRWNDIEGETTVRIRAEHEQENYFDVYGKPEAYVDIHGRRVSSEQAVKEMEDLIERKGCFVVIGEFWDGQDWQIADTIGMCTGYDDVLCPFENDYVVDIMAETLRKYDEHCQQQQLDNDVQCGLEPCPVI